MFYLSTLMVLGALCLAALGGVGGAMASLILVSMSIFLMNLHVSTTMVRLEMLSLLLGPLYVFIASSGGGGLFVLFVLFSVSVIEASVGLSLLVLVSRSFKKSLYGLEL